MINHEWLRRTLANTLGARTASFAFLQTLGSQGLVVLLNLATGVVVARLLGPSGRGEFTAITLWPQFLALAGGLGLPVALTYHLRRYPDHFDAILTAGWTISVASTVVLVSASAMVVPWLLTGYAQEVVAWAQIGLLLTFINNSTIIGRASFLGENKYAFFNISHVGPPLFFLTLLVLVWQADHITPVNASLCLLASGFPVFALMIYILLRDHPLSFPSSRRWYPSIASYCGRVLGAEMVTGSLTYIDRILLIVLVSPAELGLYAVAYSVSRLVLAFQTPMISVLLPSMAGRGCEAIVRSVEQAMRFTIIGVGAMLVVLGLLGDILITLAYGEAFADAGWILAILLAEAGLSCLSQVGSQAFMALGRPGRVSLGELLALLVAIILIPLLAPVYGAVGAAAALLAAGVTRATWTLTNLRLSCGVDLADLRPGRADIVYIRRKLS